MTPTPWLPWLPSPSALAFTEWALNKMVPLGGRGMRVPSRGIPRHGYPLTKIGVPLGDVTNGSLAAWLNKAIGLGYVGAGHAAVRAADPADSGRPPRAPRAKGGPSVEAASDLYFLMGGAVLEVNAALQQVLELVNQVPYGQGWMLVLPLTNPNDLDALLDGRGYGAVPGAGKH